MNSECEHEFEITITGSRRIVDGEPDDDLIDHEICVNCGKEKYV